MKISAQVTGQIALITGGSGGIGSAVAQTLAAHGAIAAVHYWRNKAGADYTAERIREAGGKAAVFQADLTELAQIEALVKRVQAEFGGSIDILVNNAGQMIGRSLIAELTDAYYTQMMDINLKSCVFLSQAVLPGMLEKRKGCVVNIASLATHNGGGAGVAIYAAAKNALLAFTKSLAKELAGHGIRANAVCPGVIANTANDRYKTEDIRKSLIAGIPLQREGLPEDVANCVLFLASELSAYVTGETIDVNGGMYMR